MGKYKIEKIELLNENDIENREVLVTLDNGTEIHICACYESWQQWGGTTDELGTSVWVADEANDWLHGDSCPPDFDEFLCGE